MREVPGSNPGRAQLYFSVNLSFDLADMCSGDIYMVTPSSSVGGVKVSIVAFQAIDPGSIPG